VVVQEQVRILPCISHIHRRIEFHCVQRRELGTQEGRLAHLASPGHNDYREVVKKTVQFLGQETRFIVHARFLMMSSLFFKPELPRKGAEGAKKQGLIVQGSGLRIHGSWFTHHASRITG
jgi:hypothetical protein